MEEIDLKNVIITLWNKKFFIIITTLVFALATFLAFSKSNNIIENIKNAKNEEPIYYAQTHFIIGTAETMNIGFEQSNNAAPINITQQTRVTPTDILFETYCELIKSKTSLDKIISDLELNINPNELSNSISLSKISSSDLLCLTVAYKDKDKVIQISDKLINEFINNMSKAYSIDKVAIIDEPYLLSDIDLQTSNSASNIVTSSSIIKASLKNTLKYTITATTIGFLLSIGIILFIEALDDTIKNEEHLKQLIGITALATIDPNKRDNKDIFDIIKIKLPQNVKTFLITNTEINSNIEYISNNIASSFAKVKNKVLLLNLSSNTSNLVKEYNSNGLLDYINNNNKDITKYISPSTIDNLDILLIGNNNNTYIDESQLEEILKVLENTYNTIIINSTNILNNANTLLAAKIIKNTILVTTQRKTKINDVKKVKENIDNLWICQQIKKCF